MGKIWNTNRMGKYINAEIIGTEPSAPLAFDLGTEHHHPILSMIECRGGRLRERESHYSLMIFIYLE